MPRPVVHEGAHALVGLVTGRRILSVRINRDGGGGTRMVPDSGFGFGVAASVGYIGASAAGLISAELISIGRIVAVLWLGLLLLAVMLLMVRNFFGGIVILSCGVLLFLIVRYTTAGVQTTVAYGVTLVFAPGGCQGGVWSCQQAEGSGGCRDPRRDDFSLAVGVVLPMGDWDDRGARGRRSHLGLIHVPSTLQRGTYLEQASCRY